jgi:hypothetical protein
MVISFNEIKITSIILVVILFYIYRILQGRAGMKRVYNPFPGNVTRGYFRDQVRRQIMTERILSLTQRYQLQRPPLPGNLGRTTPGNPATERAARRKKRGHKQR